MFKRGKIFGIPVSYIVLGVVAFLFKDKLKPLFDKAVSLFKKNEQTPTA